MASDRFTSPTSEEIQRVRERLIADAARRNNELAQYIAVLLNASDDWGMYVDADRLDDVVIDGRADLLKLASDVREWVRVNG